MSHIRLHVNHLYVHLYTEIYDRIDVLLRSPAYQPANRKYVYIRITRPTYRVSHFIPTISRRIHYTALIIISSVVL